MIAGIVSVVFGLVVMTCGFWILVDNNKPDVKKAPWIEVNEFTVSVQQYKENPLEVVICILNNKDDIGKGMTFNSELEMIGMSPIMDLQKQDKPNINGPSKGD